MTPPELTEAEELERNRRYVAAVWARRDVEAILKERGF